MYVYPDLLFLGTKIVHLKKGIFIKNNVLFYTPYFVTCIFILTMYHGHVTGAFVFILTNYCLIFYCVDDFIDFTFRGFRISGKEDIC